MKRILFLLIVAGFFSCSYASNKEQNGANINAKTMKLNSPNLNRGEVVMQAFAKRKSTKECSDEQLSLQDLSDLLWAANGINRPESGKRTAPSAMNKQDVKLYVCLKGGSYLYNHKTHSLDLLTEGDARPADAPVVLVLVTDGDDTWAALDAGIVSQNISIFCAGVNLADYPRASMNQDALKKALKLSGGQTLMLCHPIGYFK